MMGGRGLVSRCAALIASALLLGLAGQARAEDGYALWLRYAPLEGEALQALQEFNPRIVAAQGSPTLAAASHELASGLASLSGRLPTGDGTGEIVLDCDGPSADGSFAIEGRERSIRISGPGELSCLYGAFALLRE